MNLLGSPSGTFRDPDISPDGPVARPITISDPELGETNRTLVEQWADTLYGASAKDILQWAAEYAPGTLIVTLSMENTVLAELAKDYLPEADFLFLDTEYHFPETLETAHKVEGRYPHHTLVRATAVLSRKEQDATYGPGLYRSNPTACCRMRKVEPLERALAPYAGWVTGLRRADGPSRANAPALSLDGAGRLKISPIITWTLEETAKYIADNDLIVHPLTLQNYPSIGCATCTLPVEEGQDPRAGRWAGSSKTECGLHT